MSIIDFLHAHQNDAISERPATEQSIQAAEKALGTRFAEDYRSCMEHFSTLFFNGHELTGVTDDPRLNVVVVSEYQRKLNPHIPSNWYVIEDGAMDGIMVWQEQSGNVFCTIPGHEPVCVAHCLLDYLTDHTIV